MTSYENENDFGIFIKTLSKWNRDTYEQILKLYDEVEEMYQSDHIDPLIIAILQQHLFSEGSGQSTILDKIAQWKNFLREGKTQHRVYVAGEVAAGKTSFINFLLGDRFLPTKHYKCTAVICEIVQSPYRAAVIHYPEQDTEYLPLNNSKDGDNWKRIQSIIEKKRDQNERRVEKVVIYCPFEVFEKDLHESNEKIQGEEVTYTTRERRGSTLIGSDSEDDRAHIGIPPVCFMDFPGLEDTDATTFNPYITNLNVCHSFIFILDVSRNVGIHKSTILKLMSDLKASLEMNGAEFNPEASLFICTGLPSHANKESLSTEILIKLREISCLISEEQLLFVNNILEMNQPVTRLMVQDTLLKFLVNTDRLVLEQAFSWLSTLLETTSSLLKMGHAWQNVTTYRNQIAEKAKEYIGKLCSVLDTQLQSGSPFIEEMDTICRRYSKKYKLALIPHLPQNFQPDNKRLLSTLKDILEREELVQIQKEFREEMVKQIEHLKKTELMNSDFEKNLMKPSKVKSADEFSKNLILLVKVVVSLPVAKVVMFGALIKFLWNEYQHSWSTKDEFLQVLLSSFKNEANEKLEDLANSLSMKIEEMKRIASISLEKGILPKPPNLEDLIRNLWDKFVERIIKHEMDYAEVSVDERICSNIFKVHLKSGFQELAMKQVEDSRNKNKPREKSGSTQYSSLPHNSQIYREVVLLRQLSKKTTDKDYNHFIKYEGSAFNCTEGSYYMYIFTKWYKSSLQGVINSDNYSHFKESRILTLAYGASRGLRFVHSNGIVHRDVKPQNFLVDEGDQVVICDVGHSKEVDMLKTRGIGTVRYLAPEVKDHQYIKMHSDIYSLGLVYVELFNRCDTTYTEHNILRRDGKKLLSSVIPYSIQDQCLETVPVRRPNINTIVTKLEGILQESQC